MKYYLGLDNGGTATKAAVFDENGTELATAGMDTAMLVPRAGFTERDMDEMWEANCQVIGKIRSPAWLSAATVRGSIYGERTDALCETALSPRTTVPGIIL